MRASAALSGAAALRRLDPSTWERADDVSVEAFAMLVRSVVEVGSILEGPVRDRMA